MVGQELISERILVSVKLDHWLVLQEDGAGDDTQTNANAPKSLISLLSSERGER